jgi:hypothetical protein
LLLQACATLNQRGQWLTVSSSQQMPVAPVKHT